MSNIEPVCLEDFETIAKARLPKHAYDYYRSGADTEAALKRNGEAFKRLLIRPRFLIDVINRDMSIRTVGGTQLAFPVGVAATAVQRMAHQDGEVATAKAAAALGTVMIVSTWSTSSLEEIAENAPNAQLWFQLYIYKDRQVTLDLIRRAERAGYKALVLTIDTPFLGKRRDDLRNNYSLPSHLKLGHFEKTDEKATSVVASGKNSSGLGDYVVRMLNPSFNWNDLNWLRNNTKLPILLKGILTGEDAQEACRYNIQGIVVSNHGARQLDCVPATIEVLPEIVAAVGGRIDVFLDGGVRTGLDVLKALALGAKSVFIGRPVLWGLAYKGEEGVRKVLQIIRDEFNLSMALSGCVSAEGIAKKTSLVVRDDYYLKTIASKL